MSKVLVGIIGNDAARFHEFTASALRLQTPEGSRVEMLIGGDWCGARNSLAQQCLDGDFTHLWFMDDDHSFAPDLLLRLLAWNVPLVTPICLSRVFPFAPVSYVLAPPELAHHGDIVPIDLAGCPGSGLVELESGGAAGMLIAREVLNATSANPLLPDGTRSAFHGPPWFEYTDTSEDITFCHKAKDAGYKIYADLEARLGHITTTVVIPSYTDEHGWTTGLRVGKDYDIRVKQTYDIIEDGRREPVIQVAPTLQEEIVGLLSLPPGFEPADLDPTPVEQPGANPALAERIEIWIDDELRWWWRAVGHDGEVLRRGSGHQEQQVIANALSLYPDVTVHQIQRETDDSRSPTKYGPPVRLWDREPKE